MIDDLKNQPDLAYNSSSFQSNVFSEMSEIFKVKNNISVWQRNLGNSLLESSKNILSSNPNLEFSKIVKPDNVEKTLSENIDSSKKSDYLFKDISKVVNMFCDLFSVDSAWLRLDAVYGPMCPRFHVDNVKCRLVTTYVGPATQWLPNDIVDRSKLGHGNEGQSDEESGEDSSEETAEESTEQSADSIEAGESEGNESETNLEESSTGTQSMILRR